MNHRLAASASTSTFAASRLRPSWAVTGLLLLACNGRLAVVDPPAEITSAGAGGSAGQSADAGSLQNGGASGSAMVDPEPDAGGAAGSQSMDDHPVPPGPDPLAVPWNACNCGSSALLQPCGCGTAAAVMGSPGLSDDGQAVTLFNCRGTTCQRYRLLQGTVNELRGPESASITGLSADGDQVLLSPATSFGVSAIVYRVSDDSSVNTGLRPMPVVMGSDGSVVGLIAAGAGASQLARWTRSDGLQVLGDLPFDPNIVTLTSTPSLAVVAGVENSADAGNRFFRWSQSSGVELGLSGLAAVSNASPLALSRDGSTLTGYRRGEGNMNELFAWTSAGGVATLGVMPNGNLPPLLASSDGSVLAGTAYQTPEQPCPDPANNPCAQNLGAFRKTQSGSVLLTPGLPSSVSYLSADGSVVVGTVTDGARSTFFWDEQHGARSIAVALSAAGADLSGWEFNQNGPGAIEIVSALSGDGRVVVGLGTCGGAFAMFRAILAE